MHKKNGKKVSLSANFYGTLDIPTIPEASSEIFALRGDYSTFTDILDPFNMLTTEPTLFALLPDTLSTTVIIPFSRRYSVTATCRGQSAVFNSSYTPTVYTEVNACSFYIQARVWRNGVQVKLLGDTQASSEEQWGTISGTLYPGATYVVFGTGVAGRNARIRSNLDLYAGDKIQFNVAFDTGSLGSGGSEFSLQGSPKFTIEINELTDI